MPGWTMAAMFMILSGQAPARVQVKGEAGAVVATAVSAAAARLRDPGCRAVLGDFAEHDGGGMEERLAASGLSAEQWLGRIVFADGFGQGACLRSGVMFATSPGSRVVFACGPRVLALAAGDPDLAASLVIHEMLHTLGLPESPPTSGEITLRVRRRCGP